MRRASRCARRMPGDVKGLITIDGVCSLCEHRAHGSRLRQYPHLVFRGWYRRHQQRGATAPLRDQGRRRNGDFIKLDDPSFGTRFQASLT